MYCESKDMMWISRKCLSHVKSSHMKTPRSSLIFLQINALFPKMHVHTQAHTQVSLGVQFIARAESWSFNFLF